MQLWKPLSSSNLTLNLFTCNCATNMNRDDQKMGIARESR